MATGFVDGGADTRVGGGAAVTFMHGQPGHVDSGIAVLWDFDNDGDFSEPVEDITGYVIEAETALGRDYPSQVNGQASPGMLTMRLLNSDDRFSYFNGSSPLNQAPYGLSTGRKVRVRSAAAADNEPSLLTRDRFERTATNLGATETGLVWSNPTAAKFDVAGGRAVGTAEAATHIAVVDVGTADYYAQVTLTQSGLKTSGVAANRVGLCYRYQDPANYSTLTYEPNTYTIGLYDVVAGVESLVASRLAEQGAGMTLAVMVAGDEVWALLDGVLLPGMHAVVSQLDETEVGLYAEWGTHALRPELDDFYVWSPIPDETVAQVSPGTLFTGYVTEVVPEVDQGPYKTCSVKAEGVLSLLAAQEVPAPRFLYGQGPGFLAGRVLTRARPFDPPGRIGANPGFGRPTGSVSFPEDSGPVLDFVRKFESHELGFLHEAPEGHIEWGRQTHRALTSTSTTPQSTWSDHEGGQHGYESLELLAWSQNLVNRVVGGIAHGWASSGPVTGTWLVAPTGTPAHLNFTIPSDVQDGELIVYLVTSSVIASASADWPVPLWWVPERRDIAPDARGARIYTHISDGSDGGQVVNFYTDTAATGGAHIWYAFRFPPGQWYGTHEGIHVAEWQEGDRPPVADPPWGPVPTLYLAVRSAYIGTPGTVTPTWVPAGFEGLVSQFANGISTDSHDAAMQYAWRAGSDGVVRPTPWSPTVTGFLRRECTVVMIRGYNGSPPVPSGVATSQVDEPASQERHNAIRTYKAGSDLFVDNNQVEAWAADVFAQNADDRPIYRLTFTATRNAATLAQAYARRVNDRITLVADGATGQGVSGDFFIERVENRWSDGAKVWVVTWELSPAPPRVVTGPVG